MPNPATVQCPNPFCKAANPEHQAFCDRCETFIPKRYLWAIGKDAADLEGGSLVGDRYFVKAPRIWLDTQPAFAPAIPLEISLELEGYLRLFAHRPQVPQVYGVVYLEDGTAIPLLEETAIYPAEGLMEDDRAVSSAAALKGTLMPELRDCWASGSALRQLNWLIQLAELWQPLSSVKATKTLLNPGLVRVDGGLIRLLALEFVREINEPTLADLGQFWKAWIDRSAILDFLEPLCDRLIHGQIDQSDQLIAVLDQEIQRIPIDKACLNLITATDQGPNRQRNEDACYPVVNEPQEWVLAQSTHPLVIVCDGIGGHEGGNVASNLAIATAHKRLQHLSVSNWTAAEAELTTAILEGNDAICVRNDQEARTERQRMGTTVVAGLVQGHQLCVAHVGDSRVYRITKSGCYQVTIDDDLASREVRQGYTSYRDALQHSGSGSLTQALGMVPAGLLYVHTRRFVLDEDCIFLFCSDGLSDFDRIEECWSEELIPVLEHRLDLATACRRLIEIANLRNGHDNVTVGLMHYLAGDCPGSSERPSARGQAFPGSTASPLQRQPDRIRTQVMQARPDRSSQRLIFFWIALAALGCAGFMAWLLGVGSSIPPEPIATPVTPSPSPASTLPPPTAIPTTVSAGQFIRLDQMQTSNSSLTLLPQAPSSQQAIAGSPSSTPYLTVGEVPAGALLQVISRQTIPQQGDWLKLKVCSVPAPSATALSAGQVIQVGSEGWQAESIVLPLVHLVEQPTPEQRVGCPDKKSS